MKLPGRIKRLQRQKGRVSDQGYTSLEWLTPRPLNGFHFNALLKYLFAQLDWHVGKKRNLLQFVTKCGTFDLCFAHGVLLTLRKGIVYYFHAFLGVGIINVDPRVVVETWSVLVAGIAARFYCVMRGLRLYIFLPR